MRGTGSIAIGGGVGDDGDFVDLPSVMIILAAAGRHHFIAIDLPTLPGEIAASAVPQCDEHENGR